MDWNVINTLLDVLDGANPQKYPQLKPLHDAAMAELLAAVKYVSEPKSSSQPRIVSSTGVDNGDNGNRRI